jgi:hypothetical protein
MGESLCWVLRTSLAGILKCPTSKQVVLALPNLGCRLVFVKVKLYKI